MLPEAGFLMDLLRRCASTEAGRAEKFSRFSTFGDAGISRWPDCKGQMEGIIEMRNS